MLCIYGYLFGLFTGIAVFFHGNEKSISNIWLSCSTSLFRMHEINANENNTIISYGESNAPRESFDNSDPVASFVIPLKRIGRLYVIEATIDGETGYLIFDTGATNLVLNRTYFRDYIKSGEHLSTGITGQVAESSKITANEMYIGDLKFKQLRANLADLGHIENRRGVKVLGLFGFELIKSYEIIIDIVNNKLILNAIDKKGNLINVNNLFKADYTQKVETANNIMFVKAAIGGKSLRFCFDTGAETNAINSNLNKTILQTISITRSIKLKGAGTDSREVIYGLMNNFMFGDSLMNNMETIVTYMDHLNEAYGVGIDGVLGFDFISRGNFCINFVKNQMGISYITQARQ